MEKKITLTLNMTDAGTIYASLLSSKDSMEKQLDLALKVGHLEYAQLMRSHIARHDAIAHGITSGEYTSEDFEIRAEDAEEAIKGVEMHLDFAKKADAYLASEEESDGGGDTTPTPPDNVTRLFE